MNAAADLPYLMILILVGVALVVGAVLWLILRRVYKPKNVEKPVNNPAPVIDIPRSAGKKSKRCPVCESTYTDENLSYCLSDGARLEGADDEVETVVRSIN